MPQRLKLMRQVHSSARKTVSAVPEKMAIMMADRSGVECGLGGFKNLTRRIRHNTISMLCFAIAILNIPDHQRPDFGHILDGVF